MQVEQAERIRRQWEAKGNLPCNHPAVKESITLAPIQEMMSAQQCGRAVMREHYNRAHKKPI